MHPIELDANLKLAKNGDDFAWSATGNGVSVPGAWTLKSVGGAQPPQAKGPIMNNITGRFERWIQS